MLTRLQDVFESFQKNNVKYVVIGGVASVLHGVPRTTFNLDILIEASSDNAQRLLKALTDAGFGTATLTNPDDLVANEITVFADKVRIDVQTQTPGLKFQDAWLRRKTINYHGQDFFVVSRADLIASKRACNRPIDMEDVRALEETDRQDSTQ